MPHCRSAADVPQDRDLLLTFSDDCKPSFCAYVGSEDEQPGPDQDESTVASAEGGKAADSALSHGEPP